MWYFQSINEPEKKFLLLPGKDYMLGRRDCDIIIENDPSVSRKHAILKVSHSEANVQHPDKLPELSLRDVSKFGTYVNGTRVSGEVVLKDGDEVKFGSPKSRHRIVYEPFIVTASCLDSQGKKEVRQLMCRLGGHLTSEWQKDCSYLVMKHITVTVKVVCALVSQRDIVTAAYLRAYLRHLEEGGEKPDPASFLPPVAERLANPDVSFSRDPLRSRVFLGMRFYFLCRKQFDKMSLAVELGGGVPILCESSDDTDLDVLVEDKVVVMSPPASDTQSVGQEWIAKVCKHLERHRKHFVHDAEIGYAVLYCSTDDFCNPDKDVSHLLSAPLASQSLSYSQAARSASQAGTGDHHRLGSQPFKQPVTVGVTASVAKVEKGSDTDNKTTSSEKVRFGSETWRGESVAQSTITESTRTATQSQSHRIKMEPLASQDLYSTVAASFAEDVGSSDFHQTRSRSPASDSRGRRMRERSRSPSDTGRQTRSRSRSPVPKDEKPVSSKQKARETPTAMKGQARSRSPVDSKVIVRDSETSPASRLTVKGDGESQVKMEKLTEKRDDITSKRAPIRSLPETMPSVSESEAHYDSENTARQTGIKTERRERINLLDDSDDDEVVMRKPAPSRKKRRKQDTDSDADEGDNAFDFNTKRSKKSPAPSVLSDVKGHTRSGLLSEGQGQQTSKARAVEPEEDASALVSENASEKQELHDQFSPSAASTLVSGGRVGAEWVGSEYTKQDQAKDRTSENDSSDIPVPRGFLTTRVPIRDQVEANKDFERQDIQSTVVVKFSSLIKPSRVGEQHQDQTGVPAGMMKWQGKVVPNFKKFCKVRHAGSGQLPQIIGGRDLEEHCGKSKKEVDDWLRDMQRAESQQTIRDREALELFNYQPNVQRNRGHRR